MRLPNPYIYLIMKTRTIDGDSLEVEVDLGFHISRKVHVRIIGIDAPERTGAAREAGVAVTEVVRKWISCRDGQLALVSNALDKYGRVLGDIHLVLNNAPDDAHPSLSEMLLQSELVHPYDGTNERIPFSCDELDTIAERANAMLYEKPYRDPQEG